MATSPQANQASNAFAVIPGRAYAIDPSALASPIPLGATTSDNRSKVAVISVRGGLICEAYDYLSACVCAAFADPNLSAVVLDVRSPGGEVAGAFSAARQMRAAATTSGKRFIGFTDGQACSAGYALIAATDEILATDSAVIGSIGVISLASSAVRQANALGIDLAVIASGNRKADGNPALPLTDAALAAMQVTVDDMAASFFGLVTELRPQLKDPAFLEAAVFVGAKAKSINLVDDIVASIDDAITRALAAKEPAPTLSKEPMADNEDKDKPKEDATRASLVTASQSDDPEKAKRAKAALAAYDSDDEEEDKKDKAESEEEPKATAAMTALVAQVQSLTASLETERKEKAAAKAAAESAAVEAERTALFASRADLSADLVATLKTLPLAQAKAIIAGLPATGNPLVATTATPTAGAGQGNTPVSDHATAEERARLDAAFGITKVSIEAPTLNASSNVQTFGRLVTKSN